MMLETPAALGGMVTAPHHLAAQAGRDILAAGGTAIEAAVAAAATLAVVYPHMTGLGGDGFWLIGDGTAAPPLAIHAQGRSGHAATPEAYARAGLAQVPWRGPMAALTVPGTVAGWERALAQSALWQPGLPLGHLLAAAIHYAETGMAVTRSQSRLASARLAELQDQPGFAEVFLPGGRPPAEGQVMRQPALAGTLRRLVEAGLRDFYQGQIAAALAADLARAGAPLDVTDLAAHRAETPTPLRLRLAQTGATVWNTTAPTQGIASHLILGMAERLDLGAEGSFAHLHGLIEATKQAFLLRDRYLGDPAGMAIAAQDLLEPARLDDLVRAIDPARALPWPRPAEPGDTIWLGVTDAQGRTASFIQSLYYEFGSGVVSPETGILMQNRGASFSLAPTGPNRLGPRRLPFTTLNPALAQFDDGRQLTYGTMGGEGQPQTQSAIFTRIARFGMAPQAAVTAPRWLLGKTWGEGSPTLKVESRFPPETVAALRAAGHEVDVTGPFEDFMGHAGAILRSPDGILRGATDPRSDGAVAAL